MNTGEQLMKNTVTKIVNYFIKFDGKDVSKPKYRVIKEEDKNFKLQFRIQQATFTSNPIHEFDGKFKYVLVSGDYNYQPFWNDTGIEFTQEEKEDLNTNTKWVAIPESDYKWSDFLIVKQFPDLFSKEGLNNIRIHGAGYAGSDFTHRLDDYGTKAAYNFLTALQKVFPKKDVFFDYSSWGDDGIVIGKESN